MAEGERKMKSMQQRNQELIGMLMQLELTAKLFQLQVENPGCAWLQAAMDMNPPTCLKVCSDSKGK